MNDSCIVVVCSKEYLNRYNILAHSINKFAPNFDLLLYTNGTVPTIAPTHLIDISSWKRNYKPDWEHYCALRPMCIKDAFSRGYENVILLGADTEFFDYPKELVHALVDNQIVFTPYTLKSLGNEAHLYPHDGQLLRIGQMNADCIGIKNTFQTMEFLNWLEKTLETDIRYKGELVLDQFYWNYAFSLVDDVKVIRIPGYNVQYCAVDGMVKRYDKWYVNGYPLVLFHYAGYNGDSKKMSVHQNRFIASPEIEAFYDHYKRRL
jgi:hypothetical protein